MVLVMETDSVLVVTYEIVRHINVKFTHKFEILLQLMRLADLIGYGDNIETSPCNRYIVPPQYVLGTLYSFW